MKSVVYLMMWQVPHLWVPGPFISMMHWVPSPSLGLFIISVIYRVPLSLWCTRSLHLYDALTIYLAFASDEDQISHLHATQWYHRDEETRHHIHVSSCIKRP